MAVQDVAASRDAQDPEPGEIDQELLEKAAAACNCRIEQIEDILPCTPLQEGMLAMTAKSDAAYVSHMTYPLRSDTDIVKLHSAIDQVCTAAPILRARMLDLPGVGLVQVHVNQQPRWISGGLDAHRAMKFRLGGESLSAFSIVTDKDSLNLIMSLHHAAYDGYTLRMIVDAIQRCYETGQEPEPFTPFQAFIDYILGIDHEAACDFWQQQLAASEAPAFPFLPFATYTTQATQFTSARLDGIAWSEAEATPSTVIRAAWSILAAKYTNSDEAIFGITTSGRQANLQGIETVAGPTIATVPMRVRIGWDLPINEWLHAVQQQSASIIQFEQTGLQNIRKIDPQTAAASVFQTLLVVQPENNDSALGAPFLADSDFGSSADTYRQELGNFNSYALMLECALQRDGLELKASFDDQVMPSTQVTRLLNQLLHVVRELCRAKTIKVSDAVLIPPADLADIWTWNRALPETVDKCIHDIIIERGNQYPDQVAVDAWDGMWTYTQLLDRASALSRRLAALGVRSGDIIPLCFEKCKWMPIAMLAVTMTGAASAAMDHTQPEERLRGITTQVDGPVILTSVQSSGLARRLTERRCVILDDSLFLKLADTTEATAAHVHPSDRLCVVFTSGSTGQPKGSIITHANFCTAIHHHQRFLQIKPGSRVYEFSSYAFDAAWSNIFHTLAYGGCVCIPHDDQRRNNLEPSIADMESTFVFLTPSIARTLEPANLSCLETIIIGGENIVQADIARWAAHTRVVVAYGPTECTIYSSFTDDFFTQRAEASIGKGCGLNTWVVDPDQPMVLVPVGCVGELLLEGPLLAPGYLNNTPKTAEAFLTHPPWLLAGGREGRLYKTGDLVRYTDDGTLLIIGRKDTQVKIRGQRVELSEIELHIREHIRAPHVRSAVEVVVPRDAKKAASMLVAFFDAPDALPERPMQQAMACLTRGLEQALVTRLPVYMVPTAYLPVAGGIQLTSTGKVDRRALRELGSSWTREQIASCSSARTALSRPPQAEMEIALQKLWSAVLDLKVDDIHADSHFFHTGGDSISAMRLVHAASAAHIRLTVADIFRSPVLGAMAAAVSADAAVDTQETTTYSPFSLTDNDTTLLSEQEARAQLQNHTVTLQDVLPITPTQAQYIRQALQTPPQQWNYFYVDLQATIPNKTVHQICQALWDALDALRLVFFQHNGVLYQAIIGHSQPNTTFQAMDGDMESLTQRCVASDLSIQPELGATFTHFFILRNRANQLRLVTRMSHAQYDGISMGVFSRVLAAALAGTAIPSTPSFALFINHWASARHAGHEYWRQRLHGSRVTRLGGVTSTDAPSTTITAQATAPLIHALPGTTPATTFLTACYSALQAFAPTAHDVLLAVLISGRSTLPPSLESTFGACLSTIPLRIQAAPTSSLAEIASSISQELTASLAYEAVSFEDAAVHCTEWTDHHPGIAVQYQNVEEQPRPRARGVLGPLRFVERDPYVGDGRVSVLARPVDGRLVIEVAAREGLYTRQLLDEVAEKLKVAVVALNESGGTT